MKKTILAILALALGLGPAAQAQRRGGGRSVSLGLKAGVSLTNFIGADADAYNKYRTGFHAGVFANIGLTSLVAFQPELLYSQKGHNYDGNFDRSLRLHYLDVPLAFHLNTGGLFVEAGPQVGFLAGANYHFGSASTDVQSNLTAVDVGYLFGLGYQLKRGLGLGLRYNGGFNNVDKPATFGNVTYQSRARNSAFQLYLTYSVKSR